MHSPRHFPCRVRSYFNILFVLPNLAVWQFGGTKIISFWRDNCQIWQFISLAETWMSPVVVILYIAYFKIIIVIINCDKLWSNWFYFWNIKNRYRPYLDLRYAHFITYSFPIFRANIHSSKSLWLHKYYLRCQNPNLTSQMLFTLSKSEPLILYRCITSSGSMNRICAIVVELFLDLI